MNCYYCRGVDTVEEQLTRLCDCDTPHPFIAENVPAFVCRLCGDKSFSGETLTALEKITNGEAQVSNLQVIQVFDFQQLDKTSESVAGSSNYSTFVSRFLKEHTAIFYNEIPQRHTGVMLLSSQHIPEHPPEWRYAEIQPNDAWKSISITAGADFSYTHNVSHFSHYKPI